MIFGEPITHGPNCYCKDCDNERLLIQSAQWSEYDTNGHKVVRFAGIRAFFDHLQQATGHVVTR